MNSSAVLFGFRLNVFPLFFQQQQREIRATQISCIKRQTLILNAVVSDCCMLQQQPGWFYFAQCSPFHHRDQGSRNVNSWVNKYAVSCTQGKRDFRAGNLTACWLNREMCVCVWGGEKQSNCQIKCHFPVIETKVNKNTSSHPSVAVTPCSECCCVSEHKPVATAGEMQSDPESGWELLSIYNARYTRLSSWINLTGMNASQWDYNMGANGGVMSALPSHRDRIHQQLQKVGN